MLGNLNPQEKKTYVRMTGGLGNQLFKLMNAFTISKKQNRKLILDISWFSNSSDPRKLVASRDLGINYFPSIRQFKTFQWKSSLLFRRTGQIARRLPTSLQIIIGYLTEENMSTFVKKNRAIRFIDGSFEDISLFPSTDDIHNLLKFPLLEDGWLKEKLREISTSNTLALHVRRGDYMNLREMYDIVSITYYQNAIKEFELRHGKPVIYLFSDDLKNALEFLDGKIIPDFIVDTPREVTAPEILRLMSNFKGIIASNSTFSWWAGFLGKLFGTCEFVAIPDRFVNLPIDNPLLRLTPDGWHCLPAS